LPWIFVGFLAGFCIGFLAGFCHTIDGSKVVTLML